MSWFPYGDNKKTGVSWKLGILGAGETHCLCVCSVVQSRSTLCDPVDCNPLDSSAYRIFQARILEWVAISSCREFSWPRDRTRVSCIAGRFFWPSEPPGNIDCPWYYFGEEKLDLKEKWFGASHSEQPVLANEMFLKTQIKPRCRFFPSPQKGPYPTSIFSTKAKHLAHCGRFLVRPAVLLRWK